MTVFLCCACGTSFEAGVAPEICPICMDGRQYVPASGQAWTSPEQLAQSHRNSWQQIEPGLLAIQTVPSFAINQRALLLRTPTGNILWDCVALLDDATKLLIAGLGGLSAIAISHPHYYTTMQDWAAAFDAPIYLHAADQQWICRPSDHIRLWEEDALALSANVTLVHGGGHFPGGTVLHWTADDGMGVLLAGDIVQVTPGRNRVSFMWSYPNMIPLSVTEVADVAERLAAWPIERIYGAFAGQNIASGGQAIIARSAQLYIDRIGGRPSENE
ncbi:MBL fold metallo-hydrolase [Neorhizobium lilium]|uniref:MBL fold metallo-hydrolase n=1 Tax=Neorhizobium lilium TaxID=2503024 RepID=A0A3S3SUE0_9HYPH|nr:MBL fold metallo-hydrolase [Neorhizobium lilium]RWX75034.1 MBL fold metallo-hydrolase [Neorhizobium lilium]